MAQGLTVLAPIRRGQEEPLRDALRAIGNDVKGRTRGEGRPHIDFGRSPTIHFARLAILRDPRRGADAARLLFSSNFDGRLDDHIAELVQITSDMDAIWGRCEGYGGTASFAAFLGAHAHEAEAFYIAFRDQTVESIQRGQAIRSRLRRELDADPASLSRLLEDAARDRSLWRQAVDRIQQLAARLARGAPVVLDFVRVTRRYGFPTVFGATSRLIASLNRYPIFRFANRLTRNRLRPRSSVFSSVTLDHCAPWQPDHPGDEVAAAFATPPSFREDVITQNQLTLVTVVDPRHVDRVKAVMAGIDSYAKRLAPQGSLIGISTIHFVRWLLVDGDKRLIMLSDYDGSWENYIDEFAEMILSGLDAIWETSFGFPPDGAQDLPAFKRFLRLHQVPAEVFYSAYPDQTVLTVARNLRLARAMTGVGEPLQDLLPLL